MPDTQISGLKSQSRKKKNGAQQPFSFNFAQFQMPNAGDMTHASEILVNTAKALWEKQTEIFKLEAEEARNALMPLKESDNPISAFSALCGQWHTHSERTITHMREINDLVRNCEWQLWDLMAENLAARSRRPDAE